MSRVPLVALLFLACVSPTVARFEPVMAAEHLATEPLTIAGPGGGEHRFRVEVARTPGEQERGLMFRRHIASQGGMIFPMPTPQPAAFWMKNTLVPLDMLFIREDGTIARIASMTTPLSTELVLAGEPVAAVLELAGGRAAALGIAPGDRVRWPG